MIDIKDLKINPEKYKKATRVKNLDEKLVDEVLNLDEKRLDLIKKVEKLRARRNKVAKLPPEKARKEGTEIKQALKKIEPELKLVEEEFEIAVRKIPNLPAEDVKVGKGEKENEIIRTWGEKRNFDFEPKAHWEIGETLGIIDTKRGSKVSGSRFFYLVDDGFLLQRALENFVIEMLIKEGFIPLMPPVLIKKDSMEGMGYMEHEGGEDMYVLEKDRLVLVGTSEQSIGPMHGGEVFKKSDLPKRYMGYSNCFRREAGSYGKDTRGAFRVHQFQKIEMFSFVTPDKGDSEHEYMLSLEEKLLQKLEIPYQVSKMVSGDLGFPAARKYDLEGWFPCEKKYRELTSTSTTTNFQSRRLNIKYQEGSGTEFVHMLNGTALSQRPILAIFENFQRKDGSVEVPKVLQEWMGKKVIK